MRDTNRFLGFLSFVAVACVGTALFISSLIKGQTAINVLTKIAYYSAYLCIVLSSFIYCLNKRRLLLWIVWAVAMVLLVLGGFIL